jgi:hypothetical protein
MNLMETEGATGADTTTIREEALTGESQGEDTEEGGDTGTMIRRALQEINLVKKEFFLKEVDRGLITKIDLKMSIITEEEKTASIMNIHSIGEEEGIIITGDSHTTEEDTMKTEDH